MSEEKQISAEIETKTEIKTEQKSEDKKIENNINNQKQKTVYQQKLEQKYWKFFLISICFALFYVLGEYKIQTGIGVFIATLGQIACCIAVIKQWDITIKKDTIFYIAMIVIMAAVLLWTDQFFIHFWGKKMILLLFFILMFHEMYDSKKWSFFVYITNLLLLLMNFIVSLFRPIEDFFKQIEKSKTQKWTSIFLGLVIGFPIICIVLFLLILADEVFKTMLIKLVGDLLLPQNFILILALFAIGYWLFYCFIAGLARGETEQKQKEIKQQEAIIAITFTSILLFIYILFCGIQILYLFAAKGTLPEGYTYAGYARKGFFELLFVSVLNFFMIVLCNLLFAKNKILDIILTLISICNVILIASSAYRMILYIKTYHMTVLRILVLWFLAMLAISMIGVFYFIYRKKCKLYQYLFIVFFAFLTALGVMKPESIVVKYNLQHMQYYERNEIQSMMLLSWDAVPELAKIDTDRILKKDYYTQSSEEFMKQYFERVLRECQKNNIRNYHISRANAEKAAKEYLQKH